MTKKYLPIKLSSAKLVSWKKIVPPSVLPVEKDSKAGVVIDAEGKPHLFIFDTFAFLDLLSTIDERLVDHLSPKLYYSKQGNPAGWLIDEIEAKLPLSSKYITSLKQAIKEAQKKGWVSFGKIEQELGLA